jgi:hypothetical protein
MPEPEPDALGTVVHGRLTGSGATTWAVAPSWAAKSAPSSAPAQNAEVTVRIELGPPANVTVRFDIGTSGSPANEAVKPLAPKDGVPASVNANGAGKTASIEGSAPGCDTSTIVPWSGVGSSGVVTVAEPIGVQPGAPGDAQAPDSAASRGPRPDGSVMLTLLVAESDVDWVIEAVNATPSSPWSGVAVAVSSGE